MSNKNAGHPWNVPRKLLSSFQIDFGKVLTIQLSKGLEIYAKNMKISHLKRFLGSFFDMYG
jgi:hypothetical protein